MDIKVNNVQQAMPVEQTGNVQEADGSFKFTLASRIEEADLQQALTTMMEEIESQGNRLAQHHEIRDMKRYRSLVKAGKKPNVAKVAVASELVRQMWVIGNIVRGELQ